MPLEASRETRHFIEAPMVAGWSSVSQNEPESKDGRTDQSISGDRCAVGIPEKLRGSHVPNLVNWGGGCVKPRVCIIGAGSCGLVALKAMRDAGLDCQAFEMSDQVGGLWVFGNSNGRGGAYRSLRINTSAATMQLSGLPWPAGTPDFPHHTEVARYLHSYATKFGLLPHIQFRTQVRLCSPRAGGGYDVTIEDSATGERKTTFFAAVVVANGHHWLPSFPDPFPPSKFEGPILHSHQYIDPDQPVNLRDKRVLVVGMGNSAADIASELALWGGAQRVLLSARRGAWVLPKKVLGKPVDQGHFFPTWLPAKLRRRLVTRAFVSLYGTMKDCGLPEPDHLIGEAHPTLSDELPRLVQAGRVVMRPALRQLTECAASFEDGSNDEIDAVIFSTGYHVSFPFFSAEHITAPNNRLSLFRRIFHPEHRHVFFVGLAQPLGAILPIAALQAEWIAEHLAGRYSLPDLEQMRADVAREEGAIANRYTPSPRHTMQIDPTSYARQTKRERRCGQKRAARGEGLRFCVPAQPKVEA